MSSSSTTTTSSTAEIREQLYANLGVEPQDVLLLIDEAHNCGDTITAIGTVTMEQRDLEQASRELAGMRGRHKGADAVRHVLPGSPSS